ncbi:MAG: magnesium transporter, partial [Fimbriimonadaceae bacterium]|nr:magnesium transporter [Alphaproteobacteria bacterium]
DYMRDADDLPDEFYEIFVIDPAFRPVGTVSLSRVMRTKRPVPLGDIVEDDFYTVRADEDQEEVARTFERYDLVSAAVTDEAGRLVGVITVDDIIDVIEEEADEDIRRLAGVGDEGMSDSVFDIARSRFTWLMVNLGTAILASFVIQLFDATIEQMVALAVLMPIVASMGGNAGTQTMTVAVRALATGDLSHLNLRRVVTREGIVGFLNGCVFAVVMGIVVLIWFGDGQLGLVIGAAMIINMLSAGLFGIFVPVVLDRFSIDPAVASGPFVTTVTDVVGFFAFLGLAAFWLGLG